jgi:acetate kinase
MTPADLLMTMNAGSSTVKIGLFDISDDQPRLISRSQVDLRAASPIFAMEREGETIATNMDAKITDDLSAVVDETLTLLARHFPMAALRIVGHRVVHGGETFTGPVQLSEDTIAAIADLTSLAPLHQPPALRLIRAIELHRPHLLQSASFDTAFHNTQSDLVRRFALREPCMIKA